MRTAAALASSFEACVGGPRAGQRTEASASSLHKRTRISEFFPLIRLSPTLLIGQDFRWRSAPVLGVDIRDARPRQASPCPWVHGMSAASSRGTATSRCWFDCRPHSLIFSSSAAVLGLRMHLAYSASNAALDACSATRCEAVSTGAAVSIGIVNNQGLSRRIANRAWGLPDHVFSLMLANLVTAATEFCRSAII